MKPSEIYRLPTQSAEPWHWAPNSLAEAVFNIELYRRFDDGLDRNSSPVMVHRKLEATIASNEHWVSILTLEHEGVPFAVVSRSASEHCSDEYEVLVTDRGTYEKARAHVISIVYGKIDNGLFDESDDDVEWGNMHGAVIARFDDGYRLVQKCEVGFGDGDPIFDMKKLRRDHRLKIGPLMGLRTEQGTALALEIIGDAILRGRKTMVGKWVSDMDWFAGFYEADGYVYNARAQGYTLSHSTGHWDNHLKVDYLCHGKFYDALDRYVQTGEADLGDPALIDLQSSFELTDAETIAVLDKVAFGKADFLEAAVELLLDREVVPERFDGMDDAVFGQARVLSEDGNMARFGLGSLGSVAYARDYWARYQQNVASQKEAEEASAGGARP